MAEPAPVHVEHKTCGKCKQSKPVNEFYRDWRRGGYRSPCKSCTAAYDEERATSRRKKTPPASIVPAGHKKCPKCPPGEQIKLLEDFYHFSSGRYSAYCKWCTRNANNESYRKTSDRQGRPKVPATMPVIDGHKRCIECYENKPISEFYRHGNGYRPACKACKSDADAERRQDPEFREASLARRVRHYRDNRKTIRAAAAEARKRQTPSQIERDRHRRHAAYVANRMKVYERNAKWRGENPERHRDTARRGAARRRAANPEPFRAAGRRAMSRRRARLRNLPSEQYTVDQILERDGAACVLCGDELDLTASYPNPLAPTREHLECLSWPDATAGDVLSNVALSHWGCNNERGDRPHPAAARKRAELLAAERVIFPD